jgi:hypothetical protein
MIRVVHPGSGSRIQGSEKAPDPGSATLYRTCLYAGEGAGDPGHGAVFFTPLGSRIQGSKNWHRIRIPDPQHCTGTCVMQVKVLGTLAMVDDGEADWKMIVIGGDC